MHFMHAGSRPAGGRAAPEHGRLRIAVMVGWAPRSPARQLLIGPAAFAATGWTVEPVPQTGNNTLLTGASARTSTDAWAVGEQFGAAGQAPPPPVSYHWNGTAWSLVPTPSLGVNASLLGVSASTATDAWAVGFSVLGRHEDSTLFEHWNGTAWSVNSAAAVTGYAAQLTGVADLSPSNAWAVGQGAAGTLLEHWNGTAWSPCRSRTPASTPGPVSPCRPPRPPTSGWWAPRSTPHRGHGRRGAALQRHRLVRRADAAAGHEHPDDHRGDRHLGQQRLGGRRGHRRDLGRRGQHADRALERQQLERRARARRPGPTRGSPASLPAGPATCTRSGPTCPASTAGWSRA